MFYLKILEKFLTSVLLSKDEYNIRSKHFNPVRLIVTIALVLNVGVTVMLLGGYVTIYDKLQVSCPAVISELTASE